MFFGYAGEKGFDTLFNDGRGEMGIREPDERYSHVFAIEQMLVMTIGLAQLTLHTVAINSMLETLLGDGE